MERCEIIKVFPQREEKVLDAVAEEIPLTIYINKEELVTLLASPTDLKDLTVGFLLTSGLIKTFEDVDSIVIDDQQWVVYITLKNQKIDADMISKRVFTSGCGRGTLFYNINDLVHRHKKRSDVKMERSKIFSLMKEFQTKSEEFSATGCVHSVALTDKEKILVLREDIGRHNALDKIIGYALMNNMDLSDKIVLSSGRVSSEILLKVQKTGLSIIVSRSAPTNQAVKHAQAAGLTLIGFVRGKRMNVYNGRERIL